MLQAGHSLLPRRWHCSDSGDFRVFRAAILDFRAKLGNRCTDSGDLLGFRASILDFKPRIGNQCIDSGDFRRFHAVILDFRPRIGNRCSNVGLHAKLISSPQRRSESDAEHRSNVGLHAKLIFVSATKIRVGRGISQQRRTAGETNLRRSNEDQSRTRNIAATAAEVKIFR